ncbi:MAG TPA: GNAT family N-acetyltransferase [Acidimicrobiales bacterium]|nr:GNAT family N-acetyltransferase [Acidimicrobiales bacterium]
MVFLLANGTRVLLRPIRPGDRDMLQRGMRLLSPLARRHRFFTALDELNDRMATYLTDIDYASHFAWVAVDVDHPERPIVAVARYIRLPDDPTTAEIAFVVGDDYQRRGLATVLLDLLAIVARGHGIQHFYARMMSDNVAMRHILTKAGGRLQNDEAGVLRTTIDLPRPTGALDAEAVLAVAAGVLPRSA